MSIESVGREKFAAETEEKGKIRHKKAKMGPKFNIYIHLKKGYCIMIMTYIQI